MPYPAERNSAAVRAIQRLLATDPVRREAAEAMGAVAFEMSAISLTNLDWWEKTIRAELWLADRRWTSWVPATLGASWLQLCSGDGYTREIAVRALSQGVPNSLSFALLLRRLNDWVPQVRAAARDNLAAVAERSDPAHVVEALWVTLPHWSSWGRMEPIDREAILGLTSLARVAQGLRSRILDAAAGPVAQVLSQAARAPALDEWLIDFAATAVQPSVRARAYQFLLEKRVCWVAGRRWIWTELQWCKGRYEPILEERRLPTFVGVVGLLRAAVADRSPLVRRVAADYVVQHRETLGVDAHDIALRLAADPSTYVAERGHFAVMKLGLDLE